MRENRTHGSEGGESGSTGLPYPYRLRLPISFQEFPGFERTNETTPCTTATTSKLRDRRNIYKPRYILTSDPPAICMLLFHEGPIQALTGGWAC